MDSDEAIVLTKGLLDSGFDTREWGVRRDRVGDAHNAMFCAFEDFIVKFGFEFFVCRFQASDFIVVYDDSRIRKSFFKNAENVAVDAWRWIYVSVVVDNLKCFPFVLEPFDVITELLL